MQVEQVVELYWGACAQPRDPEGHPGEGLSWGGSLKLGLPDGFWFLGPLRGKWWSTSFRDFSHYILSGTFPFLSLCRHPNCRNTGNYGTGAHWGQFSSGVISTTFSAVRGHFCPCTLRHRNMPYAQTPGRLDRRRGRGDHRVPLGVHRGCFFWGPLSCTGKNSLLPVLPLWKRKKQGEDALCASGARSKRRTQGLNPPSCPWNLEGASAPHCIETFPRYLLRCLPSSSYHRAYR